MLSINNKLTVESFNKGYKIDINGNIISPYNNIIKGRIFNNGKIAFGFRSKGFTYSKAVYAHKLQAYQKFGNKVFEKGIVVRHLNGNPLDNSWDNIEIGTQSDNMYDKPDIERQTLSIVAVRKKQNAIRSYEDRCLIYEDLKNNLPYSEIMKKHNISSKGTLSFMKNKSLEYKEWLKIGLMESLKG